jgi:hypothetical protein
MENCYENLRKSPRKSKNIFFIFVVPDPHPDKYRTFFIPVILISNNDVNISSLVKGLVWVPCRAEPRFDLGPALQQANALLFELRRKLKSFAGPDP